MDPFAISKPLVDELKELAKNFLTITIEGTVHKVAVRLFLVTTDTPARCKVKAMKLFNGIYGCTYCLHPGVNLKGASNSSKYNKRKCSSRTHSDTVSLMKAFMEFGIEELGITGISSLLAIPDYDIILQTPIDWMHCVLLGVTNTLMELWFNSENHEEAYYIPPIRRAAIERKISNITPLKSFTRKSRSIEERKYWKANELKYWLLFYAKPCLKGSMSGKFFDHFCLLSDAMFIFSKTHISRADFRDASAKLMKFTTQYEKYYGLENMVYNVHLLDHIPECVDNCGPLWAYSNFHFEDNNGYLSSMVQGTNNVEKQILSKTYYDGIISKFVDKRDALREFQSHMNNTYVKNSEKVGTVTLFGNGRIHKCNEQENLLIGKDHVTVYKKFFFAGSVFFSISKNLKQTNDTIVKLKDGSFGEIQLIFKNGQPTVNILIKKLKLCDQNEKSHLRSFTFTNTLVVIPIDNVLEKCVLISNGSETEHL